MALDFGEDGANDEHNAPPSRPTTSLEPDSENNASPEVPHTNPHIQRLMERTDEVINLLGSLDRWADGATPPSTTASMSEMPTSGTTADILSNSSMSSLSQQQSIPMSTESFYFTSPPISHQNRDDLNVVDLSVAKGFLHVKGVFPDHSVEYVDIEPRFTTIRELKQALCDKRQAAKDLQLPAKDARIMFNGQLAQDDWLVIDCGLEMDGVIYIVHAIAPPSFGSKQSLRVDPRLAVPSIALSYARNTSVISRTQQSSVDEETMLADFEYSLALNGPSHMLGATLSHKIRPEETMFADMISDFYQNLPLVQDSNLYGERLIRGYINVIQTRLETLETTLESLSGHRRHAMTTQRQRLVETIRELRDERNTWRLLFELRRICHDEDDERMEDDIEQPVEKRIEAELHFDMTEDDAVRMLENKDTNYKIQKAVKVWLEHMAMERSLARKDSQIKAKGSHARTLQLLTTGKIGHSKEIQMDPDAVLRNGDKHVLDDDAEEEAELLRGVWSHIRAGNLLDAVDLCVQSGEPWRAASLSGGSVVGASEITENDDGTPSERAVERWGNPTRMLWKTTCWTFAEAKQFSLTKRHSVLARQYEEIIYGALAGHTRVLTQSSMCETWEDHCWAFLHAMTEQQIDEILYRLLQLKLQSSKLIVGYSPQYMRVYDTFLSKMTHLKRYRLSLDALFDDLRTSKIESVRKQANEPHRRIQAKLVTAQLDHVINNILETLLFEEESTFDWDLRLEEPSNEDKSSPLLLRFATHLVLFATYTEETFDLQVGHMIVKTYIRHLIQHGHWKLVPIYASRLPIEGEIQMYVQLLSIIDERKQRETLLKCILEVSNMDALTDAVIMTVDRIGVQCRQVTMKEIEEEAKRRPHCSTFPDRATTSLDRKRMRTLEFLCVYDEHRLEALHHANALAREFVQERKFSAVLELFREHLPEDSMGIVSQQEYEEVSWMESCVREHLCWVAYIRANTCYDRWRTCSSAWNSRTNATYTDEKEFLAELMYNVSRTTTAIIDTLQFENGWMMGCLEENEIDVLLTTEIRARCLPALVFNLHSVPLESAKTILRLRSYPHDAKFELTHPLLTKSLQVADIVADEHYGVVEALSVNQRRDLLSKLRESAIALMHLEAMIPEESDTPNNDTTEEGTRLVDE